MTYFVDVNRAGRLTGNSTPIEEADAKARGANISQYIGYRNLGQPHDMAVESAGGK